MKEQTNKNAQGAQDLYEEALKNHKAGKLLDADRLYREVLNAKPEDPQALYMLSLIAVHKGHNDAAEDLLRRAIKSRPDVPLYYYALGNVLKEKGQLDDAVSTYKEGLVLKPDFADCLNNLGLVLDEQKKYPEAKAVFEQAIALSPRNDNYYYNLAQSLKDSGDYEEAIKRYRQTIAIAPHWMMNAGIGLILQKQGKFDEAIAEYEEGLRLSPDSFEMLNNLGGIYSILARYETALEYFKRALAIEPEKAYVLSNIAMTMKDLGRMEEALDYCKQALARAPRDSTIYSNILLSMVYAPSFSPQELMDASRVFGEQIADPLFREKEPRDKNPDRKLRIGYVSTDFREGPVRYFTEHLIRQHDRSKFEVFAYYNMALTDEVTERFKKTFDHWREIWAMGDEGVAALIERDEIDILIDLGGHTGNNRLMVFARKPAPIQVSWLGYPATTGMKAMDYRITDVHAEPEGMTEHLNTETLWRLPEIFACYQADEKSTAPAARAPFEDNKYITFGCFNNFTKVNDDVLRAWAKIMQQVPNSRLLLEIRGINDPLFQKDVKERLAKMGLPADRVMLEPRVKSSQYILYNRIDIALDPFPCTGGTTSMDTLWMGVPLVTLAGKHFLSRISLTILENAGLPDLITHDVENYIKTAVGLANDHDELRRVRSGLREKVMASAMMDSKRFVEAMEDAYRGMWRKLK